MAERLGVTTAGRVARVALAVVVVGTMVGLARDLVDATHPPAQPIPDDPAVVGRFVGKTILLGVTAIGLDGQPRQQREWVGRITRVSRDEGIVVDLDEGPPCVLPPDLQYLAPAEPGTYQLHTTGRVVENPDFTTIWTVTDHSGHERDVAPINWQPAWRTRGPVTSVLYRWVLAARREVGW